ncbi:MAG: nucleotidyltransferase family protein [Gammaproteobacteria bacterium]
MSSLIEYIGLIPAAGNATRLKNFLTGSKEVYPFTIRNNEGVEVHHPVCKCLLDSFSETGIGKVYIILREGKEDIPAKLGDGHEYGVDIHYLYSKPTIGPPFTLDQAYEHIKNNYVALGFPDILFKPRNAIKALIDKQHASNADVVLALFPAPNPQKMDMIKFDDSGKIKAIDIKPLQTSLVYTWVLAIWNPIFSKFMHECLQNLLNEYELKQRSECHVGTVFQIALNEGITFDYVIIDKGEVIDMGTPEDLLYINQQPHEWFK